LCDDCKERIRVRGRGITVAPPIAPEERERPSAPTKEQEFARGVLKEAGLSEEYAAIVAERITRPGADLSKSDQEFLALVKRQHATAGPWNKTPRSKFN
jgi:rRNA maturation endonuclease Nob1